MTTTDWLFQCLQTGDFEGAETAIVEGADVEGGKFDLFNPLTVAILHKNPETGLQMGRMLIAAGANVKSLNNDGTTALSWAPDELRASFLISEGARVGDAISDQGATVIHSVAAKGDRMLLRLLLNQAGGASEISSFDFLGRTPLICAAQSGQLETVRELLSSGANVNSIDTERIGRSALAEAVSHRHMGVVSELLKHGADPMLSVGLRRSALDIAQAAGDEELLSLLQSG